MGDFLTFYFLVDSWFYQKGNIFVLGFDVSSTQQGHQIVGRIFWTITITICARVR